MYDFCDPLSVVTRWFCTPLHCIVSTSDRLCFIFDDGPRSLSRSFSRHLSCSSVVDLPRFGTFVRVVNVVTVAAAVDFVDGDVGANDAVDVDDVNESNRRGDDLSLSDSEDEDDEDDDVDDLFRLRTHDDSSCLYKYDLRANDFPHRVQVCGLVFECV